MNDEDIVKEFLSEIEEQTYDYHYLYSNEVTNCIILLYVLFMDEYCTIVPDPCEDYIAFNIVDKLSNNIFYRMFTYDRSKNIEKNVELFFENHIAIL